MEEETRYSTSGIPLKVYYRPEDVADIDYERDLGDPGEYPHTRGLYPTGYRRYSWVQRNLCGFDLPEDTNKRLRQLLQMGQKGYGDMLAANIAFDLPTQLGMDSDHPMAKNDVGKVGCVCNTVADMGRLFRGIPLGNITTGLNNNALAPISVAMYLVNAENQGVPMEKTRGQNPNNPLSYLNGCQVVFPPEAHFRMMVDLLGFLTKHAPLWSTINLAGYYITEGGGTPVQEIAFSLTYGIEVASAGIQLGLGIDDFAPRLSAFLGLGDDFFENIAKVRAMRRIYAKIMKERFGAKDRRSMRLRVMTWTAGSSSTAQQPLNNITRAALEALAGVLAGVQMIHTVSYDEALLVPSVEAAQVALMTQKIIEHETGVCDVADPLGGSYFLECLTDEIEQAAWKQIEEVEKRGGFVACFKSGYYETEILKERLKRQKAIESGERVIVGVNRYVVEEETPTRVLTHNPKVRDVAIKRLNEWRRDRDQIKWQESLARVREAALGEGELMPYFMDAVRAKATLGEITETLREVWGSYRQPAYLA